jgi:hypothetical protein
VLKPLDLEASATRSGPKGTLTLRVAHVLCRYFTLLIITVGLMGSMALFQDPGQRKKCHACKLKCTLHTSIPSPSLCARLSMYLTYSAPVLFQIGITYIQECAIGGESFVTKSFDQTLGVSPSATFSTRPKRQASSPTLTRDAYKYNHLSARAVIALLSNY